MAARTAVRTCTCRLAPRLPSAPPPKQAAEPWRGLLALRSRRNARPAGPSWYRSFPGLLHSHPARRVSLSRNIVSLCRFRGGIRDDQIVNIPAGFDNSVWIGYARFSAQDRAPDLGHGVGGPGTVFL